MMKPQSLLAVSAAMAALLTAAATAARGQGFALEGAVIDSRNAQNLGVVSERGQLDSLFRAQKAMTFGILRSAGISLDQLPPDIRARIERFQTTNIEAFRAFSQGLDLKDQGKFIEARAQFRRAAELDPGFALAVEQQQAMPEVNLGLNVQTRAVIAAAAGAAVDRGKATIVVDTARAVAAIASGQTVVAVTLPAVSDAAAAAQYSVNPPGASSQFLPNLVAGYAYTQLLDTGVTSGIAAAQEWRADNYTIAVSGDGGSLESLSSSDGFVAARGNAQNVAGGTTVLNDGSTEGTRVYWGSWLSTPGASATLKTGSKVIPVPASTQFDYIFADATRDMPISGSADFAPHPTAGTLSQPSGAGRISVDFLKQTVTLTNLGFSLQGLTFSGLNGSATYDRTQSAAGTFSGNYTDGSCTGCVAFVPQSSVYNGSFVGHSAAGLIFSTILQTGSPTQSTVSGVGLFVKH